MKENYQKNIHHLQYYNKIEHNIYIYNCLSRANLINLKSTEKVKA